MPAFFSYWTYWLFVVLALIICATVGYLIGRGAGAAAGVAAYFAHEAIVWHLSQTAGRSLDVPPSTRATDGADRTRRDPA